MTIRRVLAFLSAGLLLLAGCRADAPPPEAGASTYGTPVETIEALPAAAVAAEPTRYAGRTITVEGRIAQVCEKKGCWLTLDAGPDRPPLRVLVARADSGYAFTVPTGASGQAVIRGTLRTDTLDAAAQQHLAGDAGEAPPADDATSRAELQLVAQGVRIVPVRL